MRSIIIFICAALAITAQTSDQEDARYIAALKHLRNCGFRDYQDFSGLEVWLGKITKEDVDAEERKIAAARGWVAQLKPLDRAAYSQAFGDYMAHISEARDELIHHTIRNRQDEYERHITTISGLSESLYRSMASPCHSETGAVVKGGKKF